MKKYFFFLLALLFVGSLSAQGMEFEHGSWSEVKAQAKKENKYIFVDAFTDWCGPCKWMNRNVFSSEEAGEFYNAKFVNYKLDMEKGEGLDFAKTHKVRSYPSYLFFSPEGELVHRSGGAKPAPDFIQDGTSALDPDLQVVPMMARFEGGEREPDFLYNYSFALANAGMDPAEAAEAWLSTQEQMSLVSEKGWKFISTLIYDPDAEAFAIVTKYRDEYEQMLEEPGDVKDYIEMVFQRDIYLVGRSREEGKLEELKQKMGKMVPDMKESLGAFADYRFWFNDEEKGHKFTRIYLDEHCESWNELNQVAWMYYEKEEDPAKLKDALAWAKRSVDIDKNFYNTDTYAHLLYKTGKYKEAQKIAKESKKIGDDEGEDTSGTKELIDKIGKEI